MGNENKSKTSSSTTNNSNTSSGTIATKDNNRSGKNKSNAVGGTPAAFNEQKASQEQTSVIPITTTTAAVRAAEISNQTPTTDTKIQMRSTTASNDNIDKSNQNNNNNKGSAIDEHRKNDLLNDLVMELETTKNNNNNNNTTMDIQDPTNTNDNNNPVPEGFEPEDMFEIIEEIPLFEMQSEDTNPYLSASLHNRRKQQTNNNNSLSLVHGQPQDEAEKEDEEDEEEALSLLLLEHRHQLQQQQQNTSRSTSTSSIRNKLILVLIQWTTIRRAVIQYLIRWNPRNQQQPKSLFANERLFVHYLTVSFSLIAISVILLTFHANNNTTHHPRPLHLLRGNSTNTNFSETYLLLFATIGILLCLLSAWFTFYGIYIYYNGLKQIVTKKRQQQQQKQQPNSITPPRNNSNNNSKLFPDFVTAGYAGGTIILAITIFIGVIVVVSYYIHTLHNYYDYKNNSMGQQQQLLQQLTTKTTGADNNELLFFPSCLQQPILDHSVRPLPFDPSCILYIPHKNIFLITSRHHFTQFQNHYNNNNNNDDDDDDDDETFFIKGLLNIQRENLEGVTMTDSKRIFVVTNRASRQYLHEFEWLNIQPAKKGHYTHDIKKTNTWELSLNRNKGQTSLSSSDGSVTGIAYVPDGNDKNKGGGSLYIAYDNLDFEGIDDTMINNDGKSLSNHYQRQSQKRGGIHIFDLPPPSSTTTAAASNKKIGHETKNILIQRYGLNTDDLHYDLMDSKISSIHYFEDLLYILYVNEQMIRAFNIADNGNLILSSTTKLPPVPGHSNQWEGLTFERRRRMKNDNNKNKTLRGLPTSAGELILHLTLDSPPQIWSFRMEEEAPEDELLIPGDSTGSSSSMVSGKLVFPKCAQSNLL